MINGFFDVLIYVSENINTYILICLMTLLIYIMALKKDYIDIFDPFCYNTIGAVFATSTVLFMYLFDLIDNLAYFYSFVLTEMFFWLGYICFSRGITICDDFYYDNKYDNRIRIILYVYFFLYVFFQLMAIARGGLAINAENHVAGLEAGGFWGIMGEYFLMPILFLMYDGVFEGKKMSCYCIGIIMFLLLASHGSKGFVLSYCMGLFWVRIFRRMRNKPEVDFKKIYSLTLALAIIGALFTIIYYMEDGSYELAIVKLGERLVGYGDTFAYAFYGNGAVAQRIIDDNGLLDCIAPILSMLRISALPAHYDAIGNQMVNMVYINVSATSGPNLRHNLFELISFGYWFSILAAFFMGLFAKFITRFLLKKMRFNIYTYICYITIYMSIVTYITDPVIMMEGLIKGVIINVVVLSLIHFVTKRLRTYNE